MSSAENIQARNDNDALYTGYLAAYAEMRGGYRCTTELVSPLCAAIAADDARRGDGPRTAEDLRAKVLAMSGSVINDAIA